jgi:hypothetical protein
MTTGIKYHTKGADKQKETERKVKHAKESELWFNQTSTSNRYTALLEEEREDQQLKAGPENTLKPPPI